MARSLLDAADLPALRALMAPGALAAAAAALVDTGLLQFDPDDPTWDDRDRLTAAGDGAGAAVRARLAAAGAQPDAAATFVESGGEALALAFGAAMAATLDGNVWRAWCVLDAGACDDGRVWEVARAAADAPAQGMTVLAEGGGATRLWQACGWRVHEVPAGDPVWLLGALDQTAVEAPAVVVLAGD